jgi:RIO kinase 1
MPRINLDDYEDFDSGMLERHRERSSAPRRRSTRARERLERQIADEILARQQFDERGAEAVFDPTYRGSRHERLWFEDHLSSFYHERQITDVLARIKGGKEATVYCCAGHPSTGLALLAAKIYRPRALRNLRNDARYRTGRALLDENGHLVKDSRALHAALKKTRFGQEVRHTAWLAHEYLALQRLHAAGCDVPRPVAQGNNTVLMEYLGDVQAPAPTLHAVRLGRREARRLFDRLLHNIELMLTQDCVHADLSAFNVLYWEGDIRIIDFPQAVNPWINADAFELFERDVVRLSGYFARYGLQHDGRRLAAELWSRARLPGPDGLRLPELE